MRMRHRGNSLEDSPNNKSLHRLSLPPPEARSASCENITPLTTAGDVSHKSSSIAALLKRTFSETVDHDKDDLPQRKKISRFLSFFRKSKHSKVEFGKTPALTSGDSVL